MATTDIQKNILHHATELFFRYGIKSVSIDDICREMGMSKKTFYQHYPTKDELVSDLLGESVEKMEMHLTECFSSVDFADLIARFVQYQRADRDDVRRIPTLVYDLQKYYPALFADFQQSVFECQKAKLTDLLRRGMDEGFVRTNLDIEMTAVFFCSVHSNGVSHLGSMAEHGLDPVRFGHHTLDILIRGILTPRGFEMLNV